MGKKVEGYLQKYGSEFHSVFKAAVYNFLTNVLGSLVSLVSSLLMAKYFGSSVLGTIAIITAVLSMANLFANFGFGKAIVRLIPEYRSRMGIDGAYAVFQMTLRIRLLFMAVTTFVYGILLSRIEQIYFSESPLPVHDFLLFSTLVVFFGSFYSFNLQTIRALKKMTAYNLLEVIPRVLFLILLGGVILWSREPVHAVYAQLLGDLASALFSMALMVWVWRSVGPVHVTETAATVWELIAVAGPFFMASALNVLSAQVDVLMIGSMLDESAVGIYQVAAKLTLLMLFVVQSVGVLAGPTISEMYYSNELPKLEAFAQRTSKLLLLVLVPMFAGFLFFGEAVLAFFGEEFTSGYVVMITMGATVLVQGWYALAVMMMGMIGHQKVMSGFLLVSVVCNVGLNALLIPPYGIEGAAFATLAGTIVANALAARYILRRYGFSVYPLGTRSPRRVS